MTIVKLFINGRSQAVRIPKSLEFDGINEVAIRREGDRLILEPIRKNWTSFAGLEGAGKDFMTERPDVIETDRVQF